VFLRQIYNNHKKFRSSVCCYACAKRIFLFLLWLLVILLVRRFVSFVLFYCYQLLLIVFVVVVLIVLHRMCVFHAIELRLNMVKCKGKIF